MASRFRALLYFLMPILALLLAGAASASRPAATLGEIDLSGHDTASKIVQLLGEWEFYWERLLTPEDFQGPNPPAPDGHIHVPGAWNGFLVDGKPATGRGYGTYRLIVRFPEENAPTGDAIKDRGYAIHIPWSYTAYTLWINGNAIASNGIVGTAPDRAQPQFLPVTVPFDLDRETLEIIVQVSNFHHRNGGIWNAPWIGPYDLVVRRQTQRVTLDILLVGAILFMGIHHLTLYMWFKERRAALYLGVTCLVVAVRTLLTSEHVLDQMVGGLPWALELKLEYLTGYAFLAAIVAYLRSTFPQETPRAALYGACAVGCVGWLITIFSSTYVASLAIPYFMVILAIYIAIGVGVLVAASIRRREGARFMAWGGIPLTFTTFHDLLHYNLKGIEMDLLPIGLFILLLSQSLGLGERFALGFRRELALSAENAALLKTVQAQLEEVRQSRRIIATADEELRRSIAERLHGRIQTRLFAIWHRLGLLRDALPKEAGAAFDAAAELREDIDELREVEIRQVSHLLHPSIVRVGLIPAVDSLVREFQGSFQLTVEVDNQVKAWDDPAHNAIPEKVRLVAYRVLEEALGNVQAHAKARTGIVRLTADPEGKSLQLEVTDDGRGFNRAGFEPKLGLHAIDARVSTIGGTWRLESRPRAGTTLTAELPITARAFDDGAAVRDPVTRLLTRDSFEGMLTAALKQSERLKSTVGLIYVAVEAAHDGRNRDDLEQMDNEMRRVAETVKHNIPRSGIAFRYDAGTIVALLSESDAHEVEVCARSVRAALRSVGRGAAFPIEARVGAASYPKDAIDPLALVAQAASDASSGAQKARSQRYFAR